MRTFLNLILCCCLFINLASCYRVETEANALPQSYSESQVVGSWKITAVRSDIPYDWDGNGSVEQDIYSTWDACDKDNLYVFMHNYGANYKFDCNQNVAGNWAMDYANDFIVIKPSSMPTSYEKIIALTSDSITTTSIKIIDSQNYLITKSWSRQ